MQKPFLRSPKLTSKTWYWSLLHCFNHKGTEGHRFCHDELLPRLFVCAPFWTVGNFMLRLFAILSPLLFTYWNFSKECSLPEVLQCHDIGETDSDILQS